MFQATGVGHAGARFPMMHVLCLMHRLEEAQHVVSGTKEATSLDLVLARLSSYNDDVMHTDAAFVGTRQAGLCHECEPSMFALPNPPSKRELVFRSLQRS